MSRMGRAAWVSLLLGTLGTAGCGQAVTSEPVSGKRAGYEIECVEKAQCVARAVEVCGGRYEVISAWTHPLAFPDVPSGGPVLPYWGMSPRRRVRDFHAWQSASGLSGAELATAHPDVSGLEVACVN